MHGSTFYIWQPLGCLKWKKALKCYLREFENVSRLLLLFTKEYIEKMLGFIKCLRNIRHLTRQAFIQAVHFASRRRRNFSTLRFETGLAVVLMLELLYLCNASWGRGPQGQSCICWHELYAFEARNIQINNIIQTRYTTIYNKMSLFIVFISLRDYILLQDFFPKIVVSINYFENYKMFFLLY